MSVGPEALLVLANAAAVVLGTAAVLLAGVVYIRVKPYDKALLITTGMLLALPFVVAAFTLSPTNFLTVVGVVLHAFGVPYGIALALNFAVVRPDRPLVLHTPVFVGWLTASLLILVALFFLPSPPDFELSFVVLAAPVATGAVSGGFGYAFHRLRQARLSRGGSVI